MSETIKKVRLGKIREMREAGIDPYPVKWKRSHSTQEAGKLKVGVKNVKVAGRLVFERGFGKMAFWKLRDGSGDLQLVLKKDVMGEKNFKKWMKWMDVGDIIGASGKMVKTKTGEKSVEVKKLEMLSKSLKPLPDKFHGIKDEDEIFRKRYLDFLLNPESREKVMLIPKIAKATREILEGEGFQEVMTPVLENCPSGAAAKPFKTHINAFDEDVFLRICMGELWQKRMMVGGFEKTFEIGKNFRNEGVDRDHVPEFSQCEWYWAFADRDDNMKLFEKVLKGIVKKVTGDLKVEYKGKKLDFGKKFQVVKFLEAVKKETGINVEKFEDAKDLKKEIMKKTKVNVKGIEDRMLLIDELWKKTARPKIWGPCFVIDYPTVMKPLAKRNPQDPEVSHSFQLVIDGAEMANAYSELNDPIEQEERFKEQKKMKDKDESFGSDDDFVEALEYGMPPVSGLGFGLERLAMVLGDAGSLREVTAFPFMKKGRKGKK